MKSFLSLVCAVVVAIGIGIAAEASSSSPETRIRPATPFAIPDLARLQTIARTSVLENEDPDAHAGVIVLTTREHAAGGDIVNSNQPVYELIIRGEFVCVTACSHPPGGVAPRGAVLVLTVDRRDLEVTDFGLQDQLPAIPPRSAEYSFQF